MTVSSHTETDEGTWNTCCWSALISCQDYRDNVSILASLTFVSEQAVLGYKFKHRIGDVNSRYSVPFLT